jgi:hypothetical protein
MLIVMHSQAIPERGGPPAGRRRVAIHPCQCVTEVWAEDEGDFRGINTQVRGDDAIMS